MVIRENVWFHSLTFHTRLVQVNHAMKNETARIIDYIWHAMHVDVATSQTEREERIARRNRETAGERVMAGSKTDTALKLTIIGLVSTMHMDA